METAKGEANATRERANWWLMARPIPNMRLALRGLSRFLATPVVAKFRLFVWLDQSVLPDHQLVAVARADDCTFDTTMCCGNEVTDTCTGAAQCCGTLTCEGGQCCTQTLGDTCANNGDCCGVLNCELGPNVCCTNSVGIGTECTSDDECCGTNRECDNQTGLCCRVADQACSANEQCCSGMCSSDVCVGNDT